MAKVSSNYSQSFDGRVKGAGNIEEEKKEPNFDHFRNIDESPLSTLLPPQSNSNMAV